MRGRILSTFKGPDNRTTTGDQKLPRPPELWSPKADPPTDTETGFRCVRSSFPDRSTRPQGAPIPPTKTQAAVPDETLAHAELRMFRTALHEVVRQRLSDIGGRTAAPRTHGFDELARLPLRAVGARGNVDP